MKNIFTLGVLAFLLFACAITYEVPTGDSKKFVAIHNSDIGLVLSKAKRVLILDDFQIQSSDDNAGVISTSLKNFNLNSVQADCGKTMGLDYLKDNRTKTELAINILVDNTTLQVISNIQGGYKLGSVDQDVTLTCISKGVIEQKIGRRIVE